MLTFLFTDIEGSSEKWEKFGDEMGKALAIHDAILKEQIERYGGRIFKHTGDGVLAVFDDGEPIECAINILSFTINHRATPKDVKEEAEGLLSELESELPLKTVADMLKKGKEKNLTI